MIDGVLGWFNHVERIETDRITKQVYVKECAGTCSVGRPWKRWIDTMKDCLKKKGVCMSGKQEKQCMIGLNGGGLQGGMHGAQPEG